MDRFHLMIEALQGSPCHLLEGGRCSMGARRRSCLPCSAITTTRPPGFALPSQWRASGSRDLPAGLHMAPDPAGSIVTRSKIVVSFPSVIAIW